MDRDPRTLTGIPYGTAFVHETSEVTAMQAQPIDFAAAVVALGAFRRASEQRRA